MSDEPEHKMDAFWRERLKAAHIAGMIEAQFILKARYTFGETAIDAYNAIEDRITELTAERVEP